MTTRLRFIFPALMASLRQEAIQLAWSNLLCGESHLLWLDPMFLALLHRRPVRIPSLTTRRRHDQRVQFLQYNAPTPCSSYLPSCLLTQKDAPRLLESLRI